MTTNADPIVIMQRERDPFTTTCRLSEAFPDEAERAEILADLLERGSIMIGGGAEPAVIVTLLDDKGRWYAPSEDHRS